MERVKKILFYIILFYIIFDNTRNYTFLPKEFGYFKDFIITIYFIYLLLLEKIYINKKFIPLFIFLFWNLFIFVIGIGPNIKYFEFYTRYYKYIEILMLTCIFYNYINIENKDNIIKKYFIGIYILIFINFFGYFIPNPIVHREIGLLGSKYRFIGRISVGNPSIISFVILIAIIYKLIYEKKLNGILLIGFFSLLSFTGIASFVIVYIYIVINSYIMNLSSRKKYNRYNKLLILTFIIFLAFNKNMFNIFIERFYNFFYNNDESMNIRKIHSNLAFAEYNFENFILGKGMLGYRGDNLYRTQSHFVTNLENQYKTLLAFGGVVSILLYVFFLFENLLKKPFSKQNEKIMENSLYIILIIYSYTLDTLEIIMIMGAFLLWWILSLEKRGKNEKNSIC